MHALSPSLHLLRSCVARHAYAYAPTCTHVRTRARACQAWGRWVARMCVCVCLQGEEAVTNPVRHVTVTTAVLCIGIAPGNVLDLTQHRLDFALSRLLT